MIIPANENRWSGRDRIISNGKIIFVLSIFFGNFLFLFLLPHFHATGSTNANIISAPFLFNLYAIDAKKVIRFNHRISVKFCYYGWKERWLHREKHKASWDFLDQIRTVVQFGKLSRNSPVASQDWVFKKQERLFVFFFGSFSNAFYCK